MFLGVGRGEAVDVGGARGEEAWREGQLVTVVGARRWVLRTISAARDRPEPSSLGDTWTVTPGGIGDSRTGAR